MNSSALLRSYYDHSGEQHNNLNDLVAHSLIHVVQNYLLKMTSSLVLTLCCRNAHTCNFYNEMLGKFFLQWGLTPTQIVFKQRKNSPFVAGRRNHNLILVDSYKAFAEIDIAAHTFDYNYNEYYHIFLQQRDIFIQTDMQRIFEYCWRHQLINCNVQTQSSRGEIRIYTYYPFSESHCDQAVKRLINIFNGTALTFPELFPRKLLNFYGCTLRAALWHVPPFLYLKRDEDGRYHVVGGFEGQLLRELAKKLNFSIAVTVPPRNEQRGIINESGVANGALGMLQRNEVELSLGSFRQNPQRSLLATATHNYYQTRQVLCLYKAAYEFSSLDVLLYPFPVYIWCALILVFLMVSVLNYATNRILDNLPTFGTKYPCLNVLLIFVGMPITSMSAASTKRLFCIALMLFTLIVRTIYQGLLYHLIRTHQSNPMPTTISELVSENYTIVRTENTNNALNEIAAIQSLKKIIVANASEESVLKHYTQVDKQLQADFEVMPQNFFSMQVTMYLSKHSYLLNEFNEQINWMRAAGMIAAWLRAEFGNLYAIQKHIDHNYQNLRFHELSAIFWFLIIAFILAIITFVLEHMSLKFYWLRYIFSN